MARSYWLVKSEPTVYAFAQLLKDKTTRWDGIRSYEARNNLRAMHEGDLVLFYHSNEGKSVVGVATVTREAYPDPTSDEDWSVVDLGAVMPLARAVSLDDMRANAKLTDMVVLKKSRLSVTPVTEGQFNAVLAAGKTNLAKPAAAKSAAKKTAAKKKPKNA